MAHHHGFCWDGSRCEGNRVIRRLFVFSNPWQIAIHLFRLVRTPLRWIIRPCLNVIPPAVKWADVGRLWPGCLAPIEQEKNGKQVDVMKNSLHGRIIRGLNDIAKLS